ncbi:hypothetical protein BpHYR1_007642 [Brachionus plicatilis]|uniref:Uncharacterized protein n=1 Tax=Brachionus plicatilis TaxID=10195 RepID=A0A3M7RXJ8_BRAPC|nr:hypothetical protein BpHYR1_007642 [Brachionus plicatilis]
MVNTSLFVTNHEYKRNYHIEKASPEVLEKQWSNSSIRTYKKDDRVPRMSKGSRRLNGLEVLPRRRPIPKFEQHKTDLDYDEEGYEIMYESKLDEKISPVSHTNSELNSAENPNSV